MMSTLSSAAAEAGLAGLTFASGIPGTVGGGVYMNAGAYGGEMAQVVSLVEGFDMTGEAFRYTGEEMDFAHRHTRLMDENKLITHVTFQLQPGKKEDLLAEMVDFNTRRAEKQPLTQFSAGSTFKRPPNGFASAMVDQCGLKGFTIGGAQVSEKHAGFCINKGGTAADFLALMAHVQDSNIIRRAGMDGQRWVHARARQLLEAGWDENDLRQLDDECIARHISPGGSADLLAVTYFLHLITREGSDTP